MKFTETKIKGLYIIDFELKKDKRGFFFEAFTKGELTKKGLYFNIVRIGQSMTNKKGIIRGMHFQASPKAEIKIVQCLKGKIYDVAVDLRKNSSSYGAWVAVVLTEKDKKMFYIPKGFAHGFETLTNNCEVQYFVSEVYSPEDASGVRFNDPFLNIVWPIKSPHLLKRDKNWPLL